MKKPAHIRKASARRTTKPRRLSLEVTAIRFAQTLENEIPSRLDKESGPVLPGRQHEGATLRAVLVAGDGLRRARAGRPRPRRAATPDPLPRSNRTLHLPTAPGDRRS